MTNITTVFSYSELPDDVGNRLKQTADAIRSSSRRQIDEVIATGRALIDAKGTLPHGAFRSWLDIEFGWKERTAQRYMLAAKSFGQNPTCVSDLPLNVVYRLAALAPDSRNRVLNAGAKGEDAIRLRIDGEATAAKRAAAEAAKTPEAKKKESDRRERAERARKKEDEKRQQDEAKKLENMRALICNLDAAALTVVVKLLDLASSYSVRQEVQRALSEIGGTEARQ